MTLSLSQEPSIILKYCRRCHTRLYISPEQKIVTCVCGQRYEIAKPLSSKKKGRSGGIKLSFLRNSRPGEYKSDEEILDCIRSLDEAYQKRIADVLDYCPPTLRLRLRRLEAAGKIRIVSQKVGGKTIYEVVE